jgi:hypothetical protein
MHIREKTAMIFAVVLSLAGSPLVSASSVEASEVGDSPTIDEAVGQDVLAAAAMPAATPQVPALESPTARLSYALGMNLGARLRYNAVEVDLEPLIRGLQDSYSGSDTLLTEKETLAAVKALREELRRQRLLPRSQLAQATAPATNLHLSFKLDPRLTSGMYMGERWVSPATYTCVNAGTTCTIEAKVLGVDSWGRGTGISPEWIPADPDIVSVSPGQGNAVKITVLRPGETSLTVTSAKVSKELLIRATYEGNVMQARISQFAPPQ